MTSPSSMAVEDIINRYIETLLHMIESGTPGAKDAPEFKALHTLLMGGKLVFLAAHQLNEMMDGLAGGPSS